MEKIHGYVFTYNDYTKRWYAVKREDYSLLFSDIKNKKVIKSDKIETLIEVIIKGIHNKI